MEWKIVNFSLFLSSSNYSPAGDSLVLKSHLFKTATTQGSAWWSTYISQTFRNVHSSPYYKIEFRLINIAGESKVIGSQCEVLLVSTNGEIQVPLKYISVLCTNGNFHIFTTKSETFSYTTLCPQDTLTVCYRIWQKEIINPERCMFRTVLRQVDFVWNIKGLEFGDYFQSTLHQQDTMQLILFLIGNPQKEKGTHQFKVEGQPNKDGFPIIVTAKLSIQDSIGKCISGTTDHNCSIKVWDIEIHKETNTTSTLQLGLKSLVAFGKEFPPLSSIVPRPDSSSTTVNFGDIRDHAVDISAPKTLNNDLLLLYREKHNNDAFLRTERKLFAVHKSILSARSHVFRAMFKHNHSLDIHDVDIGTMERLLVFLYSDKLEDVQWEQAMALYCAASNYAVPVLKRRCAKILKANLMLSNACDLLVFADKHADEELMRYIVDFIYGHREVVSSKEWDKLEASNPRLAAKITRHMYLKTERK